MDRGEPTLAPEWLKAAGSSSHSGAILFLSTYFQWFTDITIFLLNVGTNSF